MPKSNKPTTKPWQNPADYFLLPREHLIEVGNRLGVVSLATGQQHPVLQAMASRHAHYQASVGRQGHQHWASRVQELYRDVPDCGTFAEVAAQSWPDQDEQSAAEEMFNSWRQSPGHWSAVNGECSYWGYAMAYNVSNQLWYACGVFGHTRERHDPERP